MPGAGSDPLSVDHHHGSEEQQPGETYFDPDLYDPALCAVDTFSHFRKTLQTAGLEDTVVPIVAASEIAARHWGTPLGLLFIDGGHAFETVWGDYRRWNLHLLPGGYLVMHDIFPDPADGGQAPHAIYRKALDSGGYTELPMTRSLGVLKKH